MWLNEHYYSAPNGLRFDSCSVARDNSMYPCRSRLVRCEVIREENLTIPMIR